MTRLSRQRVLSIDPTSKGFAFAVLEGSGRLVEWGHASVVSKSPSDWLARVEDFMVRTRPRMVVVESTEETRRGERAKRLIESTKRVALARRIATGVLSRKELRAAFGNPKNKWELAERVTEWFTELKPNLPDKPRDWQSEDERIRIFEAVATALVLIRGLEEALA